MTLQDLIFHRLVETVSVDGPQNWDALFSQVLIIFSENEDRDNELKCLNEAIEKLSEEQKTVLGLFLKNAAFSTEVACALAYHTSRIATPNHTGDEISASLDEICTPASHKQILTLLSIDDVSQVIFANARLQNVLLMHALLIGNSFTEVPIETKLLQFGNAVIDLLNNMCSTERMDAIVIELVKDIDPQEETTNHAVLLLNILLRYTNLSDTSLRLLTERVLLRVSKRDIICLAKPEQNSERIKQCLHQLFTQSLLEGNAKYYYALSVLSLAADPDGFATAVEWAESNDLEKALLGISLLGLAAWCRSNHHTILNAQALRLTTSVLNNIQQLLSKNGSAYTLVANCVFDLYVYTLFDPRHLQKPRIIQTALELVHSMDEERQMAAEQILGLLPITTNIDPVVLHSFESVFDEIIQKEDFDIHSVVVFKILTKLRRSESEGPLMSRLKKLYGKAAAAESVLESDLKFLELAREELFSFSLRTGSNHKTHYSAFSTLMNGISSWDMDNLMILVRRMHRDNATFHANAVDASKIVRVLRTGVNPQSLSVLLENTDFQIDPSEASSYLITWLFYLLAHCKKPQAVTFYEKYADILNRPYRLTLSYAPWRGVSATVKEYNTYLNETVSRVEAVFYDLLSDQNNRTVAELFANKTTAPTNLPSEIRVRLRQILDDSAHILEEYHLADLSLFDTDQSDITVPLRQDPEKPLDLAMLYPDDLSVVEYAMEREKEWVSPLINYAYRSDRILAQRLIKEQRAYHYRMFLPEVRFDRETFEIFKEKYRKEEEFLRNYGGTF